MQALAGLNRHSILRISGGRRIALIALLGVLAGLAMPPFHLVFLLYPAFGLLVWMLHHETRVRSAFALGWAFGVGHFGIGFYWVGHAFLVDIARYGWMAPIAVLALAAGMALFPGLVTMLTLIISRRLGLGLLGLILTFAAVWAAIEWMRSWFFTGFPWNLLGTVWAFSDPVMQFAAVGGVYGLGLVTLVLMTLPARALETPGLKSIAISLGISACGLAILFAAGSWRLESLAVQYVDGIQLRLVQPNIPQHLKWKPGHKAGHVRKQEALSLQPAAEGAPQPTHVIWAETAVPYNLANDKQLLTYLGAIVPEGGHLITGAPRTTPPGTPNPVFWNSLHAVSRDGGLAAVYDKTHLVPFGEYVPFRRYLNINKLTAGRVDFSPGDAGQSFAVPGLPKAAALICYEAIFPAEVRAASGGAGWLLNVTNDAWFGMSAGPHQHFAAVRFRAVELGLPLVRVANTGISAVVDAAGRVVKRLDLGEEGVIDSGLPQALGNRPVYGLYGNWITLGLIAAAFLLANVHGRQINPS